MLKSEVLRPKAGWLVRLFDWAIFSVVKYAGSNHKFMEPKERVDISKLPWFKKLKESNKLPLFKR